MIGDDDFLVYCGVCGRNYERGVCGERKGKAGGSGGSKYWICPEEE